MTVADVMLVRPIFLADLVPPFSSLHAQTFSLPSSTFFSCHASMAPVFPCVSFPLLHKMLCLVWLWASVTAHKHLLYNRYAEDQKLINGRVKIFWRYRMKYRRTTQHFDQECEESNDVIDRI